MFCGHCGDDTRLGFGVCQVQRVYVGADLACQRVGLGAAAAVGERDRVTAPGKLAANRRPDATGATAAEYRFSAVRVDVVHVLVQEVLALRRMVVC